MKDKIALWFVRVICGLPLITFVGHYGYLKLVSGGELYLSPDERVTLLICLAVWVAYEAFRAAIIAVLKKRSQ